MNPGSIRWSGTYPQYGNGVLQYNAESFCSNWTGTLS